MVYIPHTDLERKAMLQAIGIKDIKDLFSDIPEELRYPNLGLPPGQSEVEVLRELHDIAEKNLTPQCLNRPTEIKSNSPMTVTAGIGV